MPNDISGTQTRALIPSSSVRKRYGVCSRTLYRWRQNSQLGFPAPVVINGRCYFDEASLVEWERKRVSSVCEVTP